MYASYYLYSTAASDIDMIPWCHTDNMTNARTTLQQMYDYFQDGSTIKEYLKSNCIHLLEKPKGNTGIAKNEFDTLNWSNLPNMPVSHNASLTEKCEGLTGTYAIYSKDSHQFCIGSTTDYDMRLFNHYADSVKSHLASRPLYAEVYRLGGWENMVWKPIINTPNYYLDFVKRNLEYTSDYRIFRVLQTFTQYQARIYEQAIQSYLIPKLNGPGDVTFTIEWNPGEIRPSLLGERPFIAITDDGRELKFDSINSASDILGTSRKTISTVINYKDVFVSCPSLKVKARFVEPLAVLKEGSPYKNPYLLPDLVVSEINYDSLPLKGIHAFNENFEFYKEFDSSVDAAEQCGFGDKYYKVSRYINKRFIICVIGGVSIKLLFAQNPRIKGGRKWVSCLNLDTKKATQYKSINDCIKGLGLDSSHASKIIKNYIKPGKAYLGKYIITYITD